MAVHIHTTSQFEEVRARIEQHLYASVKELHQDEEVAARAVNQFGDAMDRLTDMLAQMYQTPGPNDDYSERSFPVHNGRYRVFFKVRVLPNGDFDITLADIDDNKQSNLDRFPAHRIISFDTDEN